MKKDSLTLGNHHFGDVLIQIEDLVEGARALLEARNSQLSPERTALRVVSAVLARYTAEVARRIGRQGRGGRPKYNFRGMAPGEARAVPKADANLGRSLACQHAALEGYAVKTETVGDWTIVRRIERDEK